jgi:dTDP-4-dehydrorhamnose reductase
MKKILVIGSKGQLGNELQELAAQVSSFQFFFYDVAEMDIVNKELVDKGIESIKPDYLINCAAYTAVDKAETDKDVAFAINGDAVRNLALASTANGVKFIHISTDYVFDGEATKPYKEDDKVNPSSIYGLSKLKGEQEALSNNKEVIVIRTAWVYSTHGNNFVKTMLRLMHSRPEISVVADQYGSPTYAHDLASAIMKIVSSGEWIPGIYHFTNEGVISWYDFATEIKKLSGFSCIIHPITTDQYPTPARRPKYSVLDKTKIQQAFNIKLKDWKGSLRACLAKMPAQ